MDSHSVNIAPPIPNQPGQPLLWERWLNAGATGRLEVIETEPGTPGILQISRHSGNVAWHSVVRKTEPRKEYRLGGEVRGAGRIALQWVRISKSWTALSEAPSLHSVEVMIERVCSSGVSGSFWEHETAGCIAPRHSTHCRIILEATDPSKPAEFRGIYLDGLGVDPLEIQYCQAGYHPDADKTAVVQMIGEAKSGRFFLIDETGKEVFAEELEPIEQEAWARAFWLADFSDFRKEGNFALAVEIGGKRRRTRFFPVRRDIYTRLSELALDWFHVQRCGTIVPGWHKACHTDDAAVEGAAGQFVDSAGGWHDGSSYDKITPNIWMSIHALTHMFEKGAGSGRTLGSDLPDALDECRWAAGYLLKIATPDGRFASYVRGAKTNGAVPAENETDNRPRSGDERIIGPPCDWSTAALCSYSLANFARVIEQTEPEFAARCYSVAEATFTAIEQAREADAPIGLHSGAALLCIGLWRARGMEKYREHCSWRILSILQRQKDEGIITDSADYLKRLHLPLAERIRLPGMVEPDMGVEYAPAPFLHIQALICYLERGVDDALSLEIRGSLDKFLIVMKDCTEVSPFGQINEWTLANDPANFPVLPEGHNAFYLGCAYFLAKAAILLERDDLAAIAQRQFEWVLGRNVRGVCMVCGAGHRELGAYHANYAVYPDHLNGYQLGGVVNGIVGGDGQDYPIDFPYIDIQASDPPEIHFGLGSDPRTNSFRLPNAAWLILACGELTKMLAQMKAEQKT